MLPGLPVEEETRLRQVGAREEFIHRVRQHHRLRLKHER
jgi:hypothetical protein